MSREYFERFGWCSFFSNKSIPGIDFLEGIDGSVSIAIKWDGVSTDLLGADEIQSRFRVLSHALKGFPAGVGLTIENHFIRDYDSNIADEYLNFGRKNICRVEDWGLHIREEMASHLGSMSMDNKIMMILTVHKPIPPFKRLFSKSSRSFVETFAKVLHDLFLDIRDNFSNSSILNEEKFTQFINDVYFSGKTNGRKPSRRFPLREIIARKPKYNIDTDSLELDGVFTKYGLVMDYPDASPNWFYRISQLSGVRVHITQILKPVSKDKYIRKSVSQETKAQDSAYSIGGESESDKMDDHSAFRRFVSQNDLPIFSNAYYIEFSSNNEVELKRAWKGLVEFVEADGAGTILNGRPELAYEFWRCSKPAEGYKSRFLREDHLFQVANMAPVLTFRRGNKTTPEMLRITSDSQLVTLAYPRKGTNHTLIAGKTGGGKGVALAAEISELYPMGTNYYIAEVGPSQQWTIENMGGKYFRLDPNESVVSPLPPYSMANPNTELPLASDIVTPTANSLIPILGGGDQKLIQHLNSVTQQLIQGLYFDVDGMENSPTLKDLHDISISDAAVENFKGAQGEARVLISENLESFLSTASGSRFCESDTMDFSGTLIGVDFKGVMNDEQLASFLYSFIGLRFKQKLFMDSQPARAIMDEFHEFKRINKVLTSVTTEQIVKMGRKEAAGWCGSSQTVFDMDVGTGVIDQITNKLLLYTQSGHEEAGKLLNLSPGAIDKWQQYLDFEDSNNTMDYRQGLSVIGKDAYDLYLSFPPYLLALADSSPNGLEMKEKFSSCTNPFERMANFMEARK